jgi:hypothetical protein
MWVRASRLAPPALSACAAHDRPLGPVELAVPKDDPLRKLWPVMAFVLVHFARRHVGRGRCQTLLRSPLLSPTDRGYRYPEDWNGTRSLLDVTEW